ncbi:MAG TPA: oligosaccharide flippase family protein [Rhizomicrobium sp.]|nr:oligosaccharide flippase family protein [Rhizomicrobium sp.]
MLEGPAPPERSVHRHMLGGSAWAIALRWSVRLTGLVSTVVLARLLTPADYGVVAIAMLIVGTIEVFAQTGQYSVIIRHPSPTREHYDSAWTVSLLLGFALGFIVLGAAPLAAIYFHEPRSTTIVEILALRTMLTGTQNIGVVNFRRHLQFHKQFQFSVYPALFSFVVTIASAFILRNYWALVIGIMSQYICTVVLSYVMEPFRPRFSFSKVGEIWSFSFWTLIKSVGIYLNGQVDKVAIGGFAGAAAMGHYDVGRDVATSPTQELINPMVTTLLPVMATVQGDREKRRELYLNVLYWSAIICTSTSVGVALVTDDMADLVLGAKWHDVKPLMPWLALAFGLLGLSSSVYSAFDTIGRPRISARLQWTRLAGLCLCIFPVAYATGDLRWIAITRFLVTVAITPTLFIALARALDVQVRDFAVALWRPMAAGLAMALVVLAINAAISFRGPPRLALDVLAGGVTYVVALLLLWHFAGRPAGPEADLWRWLEEHASKRRLALLFSGKASATNTKEQ